MDNLCHTLVGAAFAEAGLKQHTRFGSATLMITANLPDVDVLVFATDVPSVAFRRGWTHGILAQVLLPLVFAGLMFAVDRWRPPAGRAPDVSGSPRSQRVSLLALAVLSYVGVSSHVFLDLLNNYGIRLLMPFSGRWFYGDALFIIDPWLWITLAAGVLLARRSRWRAGAARVSLVIAAVYIAAMCASAYAARIVVAEAWHAEHGREPGALMVGPSPVSPLRKLVIVDAGDRYRTGTFSWLPARVAFDPDAVFKQDNVPSVLVARETDPRMRGILVWSRFPFYVVEPVPGGARVTLRDLRFAALGRAGFVATAFVPAREERLEDR